MILSYAMGFNHRWIKFLPYYSNNLRDVSQMTRINLDEYNLNEVKKEKYQRHPYDKLHDKYLYNKIYHRKCISDTINDDLIAPIINLYEALMDTTHILSKLNCPIELESDAGISQQTLSLSREVTSDYRTIYYKLNGQLDVIYVTVRLLDHTTLMLSRIHNKCIHNALELNLEKHATSDGNYLYITHDCAINVGLNICTAKKSLRTYIKKHSPMKFDERSKIILGKLDVSDLLYIDNEDMVEFLSNLIEYSVLRDEYSTYLKNIQKDQ